MVGVAKAFCSPAWYGEKEKEHLKIIEWVWLPAPALLEKVIIFDAPFVTIPSKVDQGIKKFISSQKSNTFFSLFPHFWEMGDFI